MNEVSTSEVVDKLPQRLSVSEGDIASALSNIDQAAIKRGKKSAHSWTEVGTDHVVNNGETVADIASRQGMDEDDIESAYVLETADGATVVQFHEPGVEGQQPITDAPTVAEQHSDHIAEAEARRAVFERVVKKVSSN